jgi:hypothetical protein
MAQDEEFLTRKHEALRSNPQYHQKKKKRRKKFFKLQDPRHYHHHDSAWEIKKFLCIQPPPRMSTTNKLKE